MNNIIRFPNRRPQACKICETWPRGRRERLLVEDIPLKEVVCSDCLLAFWEDLMATDRANENEVRPSQSRQDMTLGNMRRQDALAKRHG